MGHGKHIGPKYIQSKDCRNPSSSINELKDANSHINEHIQYKMQIPWNSNSSVNEHIHHKFRFLRSTCGGARVNDLDAGLKNEFEFPLHHVWSARAKKHRKHGRTCMVRGCSFSTESMWIGYDYVNLNLYQVKIFISFF